MKYYKSSRFPRFIGSTGFFALIVCALIATGAAIWFAVASRQATDTKPKADNYTEKMPSYDEPTPSYNSSTEETPSMSEPEDMTDVKGEASSVPYESEEATPSEPEKEEKRSFILPVEGAIIKDFSDSALQFSATYGDMRLHRGMDIACPKGSDIKAMGSGTVISAEEGGAHGKCVTIDHSDGIIIKYCGFESFAVKQGDNVTAGALLGTSGTVTNECADQSHIHIEVTKDGKAVSPLKALGLEE